MTGGPGRRLVLLVATAEAPGQAAQLVQAQEQHDLGRLARALGQAARGDQPALPLPHSW